MGDLGMWAAVAIAIAVVAGAVAQGTTGVGFTLVVAPVCAIVLAPSLVIGTIARVALVVDVALVVQGRRLVDLRLVGKYLGPALAAVPFAVVAASVIPAPALVAGVGLATLAGGIAIFAAATPSVGPGVPDQAALPIVAGFAAGFMGVTTGMSGPPVAIESARRHVPAGQSRATLAVLFTVVDFAAVVANREAVGFGFTAVLVGAAAAGLVAARHLARRMSGRGTRRALATVVVAGALVALARLAL